MSTKREYRCDLCKQVLDAQRQGRGIRWEFKNPGFEFVALYDAETHICERCLNGIVELLNLPKEAPL